MLITRTAARFEIPFAAINLKFSHSKEKFFSCFTKVRLLKVLVKSENHRFHCFKPFDFDVIRSEMKLFFALFTFVRVPFSHQIILIKFHEFVTGLAGRKSYHNRRAIYSRYVKFMCLIHPWHCTHILYMRHYDNISHFMR